MAQEAAEPTNPMTRKGIVEITPEGLAALLGYPGGMAYRLTRNGDNYLIQLIGSPLLPAVPKGGQIPMVVELPCR